VAWRSRGRSVFGWLPSMAPSTDASQQARRPPLVRSSSETSRGGRPDAQAAVWAAVDGFGPLTLFPPLPGPLAPRAEGGAPAPSS
jgi:hypothetical protein